MKKRLCRFYLGPEIGVSLSVTDDGCAGHIVSPCGAKTSGWVMSVGINDGWMNVLVSFIHECEELFLMSRGYAYSDSCSWINRGSTGRIFIFSHDVLCEMNERVGDALVFVQPQLKKAQREFRAKKKQKAKKKK